MTAALLAASMLLSACGDDGNADAAADANGGEDADAAETTEAADESSPDTAAGTATFRGDPLPITSVMCREGTESDDVLGWIDGGPALVRAIDRHGDLIVELNLYPSEEHSDWVNTYRAHDGVDDLPDVGDQVDFDSLVSANGELELAFTGTSNAEQDQDSEGGLLEFDLTCPAGDEG